ncbi:MAG TPA: nucleotide exchange factor GrpE [Bacteroidetes bacterium]|nr:nucleotide exchange factor GrpE [Bacteroidota bacterium]
MNSESIQEDQKNNTETSEAGDNSSLTKVQAELAELNDKYIRMYSEFDNYKRRTARERIDLMQSASRDLVVALLPVVDDFDRAEKAFEASKDLEALKEGVKLVHHKLKSILSQNGLVAMESIGKEFNVDFHEAITNIPAPSKDMKGKVIDEVEKGYLLKDKVIRFAKVVVGE